MFKSLVIPLISATVLAIATPVSAEPAALKALIVTGQDRSHDWAATTPVLKRLLEETGLFTSFSPPDKGGTGEHEPVLLTIRYGDGRVFHTVLGHGPSQLKSVAFLVTFQRGAEWAAPGKVTQPAPADMPDAERPVVRE
jgi:hypothetical protein